ncbi:MAG: hypothetical protein L0220_15950 [Acidobacteria bacterium]|nr:hypothetical protein [Acidobacteriota bacterium]
MSQKKHPLCKPIPEQNSVVSDLPTSRIGRFITFLPPFIYRSARSYKITATDVPLTKRGAARRQSAGYFKVLFNCPQNESKAYPGNFPQPLGNFT